MTESRADWRPRLSAAALAADGSLRVLWDDGSDHVIDLGVLLRDGAALRSPDPGRGAVPLAVDPSGLSLRWSDGVEITAGTLRRLALNQDAERFRVWRKAHGLSQEAAGEALGLKRRMVQCYEAGALPVPRTVRLAMIGYDTVTRSGMV